MTSRVPNGAIRRALAAATLGVLVALIAGPGGAWADGVDASALQGVVGGGQRSEANRAREKDETPFRHPSRDIGMNDS